MEQPTDQRTNGLEMRGRIWKLTIDIWQVTNYAQAIYRRLTGALPAMGGMGIMGKLPQGGNPVPGGPAPEMGGRDPLNAILDAASMTGRRTPTISALLA